MIATNFSVLTCIIVDCVYLLVTIFLHYRAVIQALIDKHKRDIVTETLSIESFKEEYSFAGDRLGHSSVRFFYPKEMHVKRYKCKMSDADGIAKKLITVMSSNRMSKFSVLHRHNIVFFKITYLKRSRIIIGLELTAEADKTLNKREKTEIEKALRYINTAV